MEDDDNEYDNFENMMHQNSGNISGPVVNFGTSILNLKFVANMTLIYNSQWKIYPQAAPASNNRTRKHYEYMIEVLYGFGFKNYLFGTRDELMSFLVQLMDAGYLAQTHISNVSKAVEMIKTETLQYMAERASEKKKVPVKYNTKKKKVIKNEKDSSLGK